MNNVTRILSAIEQGDPKAAEGLLPLVYDELRKLAAKRLSHEKPGQTLQPTDLVHEAYLPARPPRPLPPLGWPRSLLRRRRRSHAQNPRRCRPPESHTQTRRPSRPRSRDPTFFAVAPETPPDELLAVNEAVELLAQTDPRAAELVKLHFFAGLSLPNPPRSWASPPEPPSASGPTPEPGSVALSKAPTPRKPLPPIPKKIFLAGFPPHSRIGSRLDHHDAAFSTQRSNQLPIYPGEAPTMSLLRFNPLLSRRVPTARKKTTLAPELLESRELTTAIPKIAIAPPAEVSILFPVFKPATGHDPAKRPPRGNPAPGPPANRLHQPLLLATPSPHPNPGKVKRRHFPHAQKLQYPLMSDPF